MRRRSREGEEYEMTDFPEATFGKACIRVDRCGSRGPREKIHTWIKTLIMG